MKVEGNIMRKLTKSEAHQTKDYENLLHNNSIMNSTNEKMEDISKKKKQLSRERTASCPEAVGEFQHAPGISITTAFDLRKICEEGCIESSRSFMSSHFPQVFIEKPEVILPYAVHMPCRNCLTAKPHLVFIICHWLAF